MDFTPSRVQQLQEQLLAFMDRHVYAAEAEFKAALQDGERWHEPPVQMACQVIDWAIQVHGGAGVCDDFILAKSYAQARGLRLADGPDEVHLSQIGRLELARRKTSQES